LKEQANQTARCTKGNKSRERGEERRGEERREEYSTEWGEARPRKRKQQTKYPE
jgi:hypothetical protein